MFLENVATGWVENWLLNRSGWFRSLRVFGLLSSSLLLFPQRFGRYVLRPSSGVCWTQEPSRNFELRPSKEIIIWRLQVQSWLQASNNTGILNTCTQLWLMESEQTTLVDSIKDIVQSFVKVPEFNKHLKKAEGHIDRNVVEKTINP